MLCIRPSRADRSEGCACGAVRETKNKAERKHKLNRWPSAAGRPMEFAINAMNLAPPLPNLIALIFSMPSISHASLSLQASACKSQPCKPQCRNTSPQTTMEQLWNSARLFLVAPRDKVF